MAAAQVGSCSSSRSRFSRLAEEVVGRGVGVPIGLGDLVEAGAVEVEGDGSKPFKRNQVCLNHSIILFVAVKSLPCYYNVLIIHHFKQVSKYYYYTLPEC